MKAVIMTAAGEPDVLRLKDIDTPKPKAGEVLVDIKAASVNPIDTKIRALNPPFGPGLGKPLGCDMAGTVAAVGDGVEGFSVGEDVYGCVGGVVGLGGTYAEQVLADPALLAPKPSNLSFRDAASLPLVSITAYEALVERANVKAGDHVLIHGGAGGVGHVALQIAKARGARVATTVSSLAKAEIVKDLGADDVIFYKDEEVETYVDRLTGGSGFDVVFDTTGGSDLPRSFAAARPMGQVIAIVARFSADLSLMHSKGLSLHVVFMLIPMISGEDRPRQGQIMRGITGLVEDGKLRPLVDPKQFGLADVAGAHKYLESGQAAGKLVLDISD